MGCPFVGFSLDKFPVNLLISIFWPSPTSVSLVTRVVLFYLRCRGFLRRRAGVDLVKVPTLADLLSTYAAGKLSFHFQVNPLDGVKSKKLFSFSPHLALGCWLLIHWQSEAQAALFFFFKRWYFPPSAGNKYIWKGRWRQTARCWEAEWFMTWVQNNKVGTTRMEQ